MDAFYFIFSRFRKLKSKKGFLSFNFYLSIFLITFGLISIILSDSFSQGYKNEILSKLNALNSDFKIINKYNSDVNFDDSQIIKQDLSLIKEDVIYTPYIEKPAIIFVDNKNYKQREGSYVLGIDEFFLLNNNNINKYLKNKNFLLSSNNIVIGEYLSNKIKKTIDDEIDILFFDDSSNIIAKKFIISNIYKTHTQADEFLTYVPISTLREFNDNVYCNGFIGDFLREDKVSKIELTNNKFSVQTWNSDNILIFLNSFDIPLKLLMWILMFLSVYSLSSLIFNLLIEKRKDLKILFLMGYSIKKIRYIILSISVYITMISIFLGIFCSFIVIYMQNKFKIINLPSEKIFQLSFLPAHFDIIYFIKYPVFLIIFTILVSLYIFNKNFKIHLK